jgi:hypothetical protein
MGEHELALSMARHVLELSASARELRKMAGER